jgi:hypothetical protein
MVGGEKRWRDRGMVALEIYVQSCEVSFWCDVSETVNEIKSSRLWIRGRLKPIVQSV